MSTTQYTTAQIMMTLAQLASTSPNERPSGEALELQEMRIFNAINSQLSNAALATTAEWQAVWVGLAQDRANLAYIAQNTSQNAFAVCIRGTLFNSLIDLAEDLNVGSVAQFTAGPAYGSPVLVSQGAMQAFTEITNAYYIPDSTPDGTNLLQALVTLLGSAPANPTLYITGHSLGGAMATMVALYLAAQTWTNPPAFSVYTFAAPTAGLLEFAEYYDSVFATNSFRYYNVWDLVPNAWVVTQDVDYGLDYVLGNFYPSMVSTPTGPGPAQSIAINQLIGQFMNAPGANTYVQTNQTNGSISLNDAPTYGTENSGTYDPSCVDPTTTGFLGQVNYQHNSYLTFLNNNNGQTPLPPPAPVPPSLAPVVALATTPISPIAPNTGPSSGGTKVTITGANFTPDCMVDFGTIPVPQPSVTYVSSTELTAVSPAFVGTVDIRVTNNFGTSAATPADQFTAPPPTSAPAVTAVTPASGPAEAGYTVTLTGTGFTSNCSVFFGDTQVPVDQVAIVSLTEIIAAPPTSGSGTVAVTVTTTGSVGSSSTPTFEYGPPVVTGVSPNFGLYGQEANNPTVTITGVGFGSAQGTVQFGAKPATVVAGSWTDTQVIATPSFYGVMGGAVSQTVDVTVTNSSSQTSAAVPADEYTYFNQKMLSS